MKCQIEGCNNEQTEDCIIKDNETLQEVMVCKECYNRTLSRII